MCRSMVDIQSPTAEIRRGKKKRKNEDRNHRAKTWAQFTGRQLRQCISSGYPWTCDSWLTSYDHCLSSAHLLWYSQTGVDTHRQVILTDRWYSQTGDTHRQVTLTDRWYSQTGETGDTHRQVILTDRWERCWYSQTGVTQVLILTATRPQDSFSSLWHFLWTSSLQLMHLKPWRPRPQIRSEQYAQNAFYNAPSTHRHTPCRHSTVSNISVQVSFPPDSRRHFHQN